MTKRIPDAVGGHAARGGGDAFGHLSGIHGAHLGKIEYIATDLNHQTIPWVGKTNEEGGSVTEFVSSDAKGPVLGEKRVMDCIDCHNRAAHSFDTAEQALNKDMRRAVPALPCPSSISKARSSQGGLCLPGGRNSENHGRAGKLLSWPIPRLCGMGSGRRSHKPGKRSP